MTLPLIMYLQCERYHSIQLQQNALCRNVFEHFFNTKTRVDTKTLHVTINARKTKYSVANICSFHKVNPENLRGSYPTLNKAKTRKFALRLPFSTCKKILFHCTAVIVYFHGCVFIEEAWNDFLENQLGAFAFFGSAAFTKLIEDESTNCRSV